MKSTKATTVVELWDSLTPRERCIKFHLGNYPWVHESWDNVDPTIQDNISAIAERCLLLSKTEYTSMFLKH